MMDINNREDFLVFFRNFMEETRTESFENHTLDSFLAGMGNWIEDMDGYYKNLGQHYDGETLNWGILADILQAARLYE